MPSRLSRRSDPAGRELLAEARFFTDEFADRLYRMYRDGDLRAWSVRIVPDMQAYSPPTRSEIRARPELADVDCCYRKSDLCEFSAVAVPGNQECLTVSEARSVLSLQSRGLSLPPGLAAHALAVAGNGSSTWSGPGLPPLGGRSLGDVHWELAGGPGCCSSNPSIATDWRTPRMFGRTQGNANANVPLMEDPSARLPHPVGSKVVLRPSVHPPLSSMPVAELNVPPDGTKARVIAFSGDAGRVVEITDGPQAARRLIFAVGGLLSA